MSATREHYDSLLGPVYEWMVGDFDEACRRHESLFARLGLVPAGTRRAADLGAGHGTAAVPLARLGFDVVAIDFYRPLLDALLRSSAGLSVRAVEGDLLEFERYVDAPIDVAVCLGDTLPHLGAQADVHRLLDALARTLAPGGCFVATFRDYVARELSPPENIIPVRADDSRILTCVLDYAPDHVTVTDLLYERCDGDWRARRSSYRKLRLAPDWLAATAAACGLDVVECTQAQGLVTFIARKP